MTRRLVVAIACAAALLSAQDLTVDQILQKHYAAMGGLTAMKAIQTLTGTGKALIMGGQMELAITMRAKRPNMIRQDMTLQGRAFVQCYDGATAWAINPMAGADPTKMGETETLQMADGADLDGALVDYKDKGHSIQLLGKEDVEGSPTLKLKLTRKNGRTETMWLDAAKFLLVKSHSKVTMQGNELEVESLPTNYKAVAGVMMPHNIEQRANGNPLVTLALDSFVVNKEIPDSEFKMPAAAPAEKK